MKEGILTVRFILDEKETVKDQYMTLMEFRYLMEKVAWKIGGRFVKIKDYYYDIEKNMVIVHVKPKDMYQEY